MQKHSFLNVKDKIILVFELIFILLFSTYIYIEFLHLIHFKCIYLELFHIYCAGCGATRMFESIMKLEFYQAFRYNPLMFILLILLIIYFIINIIRFIINKPLIKISIKALIILGIILIIYMILRNIPGFEYLKPTIV